ncbi:hypothetical protein EPICR_40231 [Candidatus Desulfarcum epimagneticum]|uniref:Uncharacterized protein n=1 Tax=uncultured Desulfobacteraceae bacterium TaxID=218296 RepID=A0A484HNY1_9BACT|nr:hypothetical protein EPICR_40231 [uncultured Desulfobacteraceae bacterium]
MKTTIHHYSGKSILPYIIGSAFLLISLAVEHSLYYIYLYFYAAGLLETLKNGNKFAVVDKTGITFFYGSLFRRGRITFLWEQITQARLKRFKKKIMMGIIEDYKFVQGLLLSFKNPISEKTIGKVKDYNKTVLFHEGIIIEKDGGEIFIDEKQSHGAAKILRDMKPYLMNKSSNSDSKGKTL